MHQHKILFILKKKQLYDTPYVKKTIHSGLYNSARFVNDMLNRCGIESHLVQVNDNNDIDRVVSQFKPTHVIIEALWVVPSKFDVLNRLHPHVQWIIRLHSEMPFISNEGSAMDWIFQYDKMSVKNNLLIAPNTFKMVNDLSSVGVKNLIFLPNYYPVYKNPVMYKHDKCHVDIGCFGAIRPMKNQLIQAVAAIEFGNSIGKAIHFHVNSERIEKGESVIKNLRALFDNQSKHMLIEHCWYSHEEFKELISRMDLGLQVSFNETFNIVAADFASENVPVVGSNEISWLHCLYKSKTTSASDIAKKLRFAYKFKRFNLQYLNKFKLISTSQEAKGIWCEYLRNS